MKRIRLLLVDRHPVVREGLRAILEQEPDLEVVAEAATGPEAMQWVEETQPDMVLMDIFLPGMGGIAAARAIKVSKPDTAVVVFSALSTLALVQRALAAGVDGFLLQATDGQVLVHAIRSVAGGCFVLQGKLWRDLLPTLEQQRSD